MLSLLPFFFLSLYTDYRPIYVMYIDSNYLKCLDKFSSGFFELKQRRNLHKSTSGNEWVFSLTERLNLKINTLSMDYFTYNDVTNLKYTVPRKYWVIIVYQATVHKNIQNILHLNQCKPRDFWAWTLSNFLGQLWVILKASVVYWWIVSWFSMDSKTLQFSRVAKGS